MFNDTVSLIKILGIILGFFSFYLIFKSDGSIKVKKEYVLLPLLLLIGTGTNDTIVKYVQYNFLNNDENIFVETVFVFSFIFSLIFLTIKSFIKGYQLDVKSIIAGLILGVVNFFGAWFFLKSMSIFQASVLFPVINVSVVVLSTFAGMIFFKEKLRAINIIGLTVALIAILMITSA
jgi:drug/metabolite transporter (DMT)-like permease